MTTVLLYSAGVVVFFLALFLSIAAHEWGHLHYAKKYGCRVSQYMIGFGPKIFSFTRGETEYGIKLVPLGGYVKIIGMFPPGTEEQERVASGERSGEGILAQEHPGASSVDVPSSSVPAGALPDEAAAASEERPLKLRRSNTGIFAQLVSSSRSVEFELVRPEDRDRLFYKLPARKKTMVMLAGPAINIAIAFGAFQLVYAAHGVTVTDLQSPGSTEIHAVSECVIDESEQRETCTDADLASPAAEMGIEPGDEIVAFGPVGSVQEVGSWAEVQELVRANPDAEVVAEVLRDGQRLELGPTAMVPMVRDVSDEVSIWPADMQEVGFLGVEHAAEMTTVRGGPLFTVTRMGEMTAYSVDMLLDLPARVGNVAGATLGLNERDQDGPVSVVGGSRIAGEVASSDNEALTWGDRAAMLGLLIGGFNLFIGVFNLVPLLPLDGGHIAGAVWEGVRRRVAALLKRPDPGYVNTAALLPVAYVVGFALIAMGVVLIIGDVVVPISTGL